MYDFPNGVLTSEVKEATLDAIEFYSINVPEHPPENSGKGGKAGQRARKHPAENHCGRTLKSNYLHVIFCFAVNILQTYENSILTNSIFPYNVMF